MKLHWGAGLLLAFLAFASGIITIVTISMHQRVDLVADDYYERELAHQRHIDMLKRSGPFNHSIKIVSAAEGVLITFPASTDPSLVQGTLYWYRPSDRSKDRTIPLSLDSTGLQVISGDLLSPGLWRLRILWTMHGTDYFREEVITRAQ